MSYNKNNTRYMKNQVQNMCKCSAKYVKCTKKEVKRPSFLPLCIISVLQCLKNRNKGESRV